MFGQPIITSGRRRIVAIGLTGAMLAAAALVAVMVLNTRPVLGAPGPGGGCFSTTGPVCTFKSHNAFADFGNVSADGCVFTDTSVQSFEALSNPGRAAATTVFVSTFTFDNCGQTFPQIFNNVDPATGFPVFTGTATFGSKLDTATLLGTAPMFDSVTGAQAFVSSITAAWQGFGPTSTFIDSSHIRAPGFIVNSHSHSTGRAAEASGVITDAAGNNLIPVPTLNALLQDASIGNVVISH
jgi:hypothetical protein